MLLEKDPKKIAAIIISRGSGKDKVGAESMGTDKDGEMKSDVNPGLMAAAEEALGAIESKDVAKFASAMKSLVSMCYEGESDDMEGGE